MQRTRVCVVLVLLSLVTLIGRAAPHAAPFHAPVAVVAVHVDNPDFTVQEMKYRVMYNTSETKKIPIPGYDFKAALTDELLNALQAEKRLEWRAPAAGEAVDVVAISSGKQKPAVKADRLLLVRVAQYGALIADLGADKFTMQSSLTLVNAADGKKIWDKKFNERIDLSGKLADLQKDNQKGLKEGVNKVLEQTCPKMVAELQRAKIQ
jgi:hypothetical protein